MDWIVVIVAAHFAILICSLEWNCNSDSELPHFVASLLAMILWSCPQCTVQCLHNIDCNLVALSLWSCQYSPCVTTNVSTIHRVIVKCANYGSRNVWEERNKTIFLQLAENWPWWSCARKDRGLGPGERKFSNKALVLTFYPLTAASPSPHSTPLLNISIWHTHLRLSLPCQEKSIYYTAILGDKSVTVNLGHLTLYSRHSMFSFKSGVKLGNFEAFREFIHKNVKLNYEGHSNSYSIFRRKLQNHLILKSSEMQTPKKELSCWITIHQGECTNKKIPSLEHSRNKIFSCTEVKL